MSSPEFKINQKVKIINGEEHLKDFTGETGFVAGTIPPESENPHRVMVSLDGRGLINLIPEHLEIILDKKPLGSRPSPDT